MLKQEQVIKANLQATIETLHEAIRSGKIEEESLVELQEEKIR